VTTRHVDVLVVGSGPAGAVTAWALAGRGIDVLMVGDDAAGHAENGGYDVVLTGAAVAGLKTLGSLERAPLSTAAPLQLGFGTSTGPTGVGAGNRPRWRTLTDAMGVIAHNDHFRSWLCCNAVAAGADFQAGRVLAVADRTTTDGNKHHEVTVGTEGGITHVLARHVVVASGAASVGTVIRRDVRHTHGIACVQRFDHPVASSHIRLLLMAPSDHHPQTHPSCVWVLPHAMGGCTIGAASVGGSVRAEPEALIDTARAALIAADPHFATARPIGSIISAPLYTGFAPERSVEADRLLVGDAAGLVNPFTGEGLSHAIHSGLLAASAIAANPTDSAAAARTYTRRLSSAFVGYFETARHAARRYRLAWRILTATSDSDHPFFAKGRRAILLADGIAGVTATDRVDLPAAHTLLMGPFLAACNEIAVATVRTEWPFIARLLVDNVGAAYVQLRPAVPFFAALLAGGTAPEIELAAVGAAIELAHLGALAFLGDPGSTNGVRRGVDWPTATAILAGDFLLAQATRLISEYAPQVTWAFCDWLSELTVLRSNRRRLEHGAGEYVEAATVFGALFEFPARIGAVLGNSPTPVVQALRNYGNQCGRAFLFAEDALALRGRRTRLDTTLTGMLRSNISTLPDLLSADLTPRRLDTYPGLRARALAAVTAACENARLAAHAAAERVPSTASALILERFATAIAAPNDELITQER
jgi:flavin-dependent dehydrogenase